MLCPKRPVPIFPLPNCVVLPGAVQALHIFEPRYRRMVADELSRPLGDRKIAAALLRPGYEPEYYTHHAAIHPALCLCDIMKHQALPDGRSNLLIQGRCRTTIAREEYGAPYRRAILCEQLSTGVLPEEEVALRARLAATLQKLPSPLLQLCCELTAQEDNLERLTDLLTFHALEDETYPAKQLVLAEGRVDFRVKMLITLIERQYLRKPDPRGHWPTTLSCN